MVYEFLKSGVSRGVEGLEKMLRRRNEILRELNP